MSDGATRLQNRLAALMEETLTARGVQDARRHGQAL